MLYDFIINEYLKVVLSNTGIEIRFNDGKFLNCHHILPIDLKVVDLTPIIDIAPVNEFKAFIKYEKGFVEKGNYIPADVSYYRFDIVPREDIFWAQCSTLQVWEENNYSSNLLTNNIAFPLLKKLAEQGDPKALLVFEKEIIKRLESNHLPTVYYLLEEDYLKYLNKSNLEIQLNRIIGDLDYETLKELKLDKKIAIFENIINKTMGEKIRNFYYSLIKRIFQQGDVKEIAEVLRKVNRNQLSILSKDDIPELFDYFDFDIIKSIDFQRVKPLLTILRILGYNKSKIYKNIIKKRIEKNGCNDKIINLLIKENNLGILTIEELESLHVKKLSITVSYKGFPEEIGYIKSLEHLEVYSGQEFATIPESIHNLINLKILDLGKAYHLRNLPESVLKLKNLQTIILPGDLLEFPEWIYHMNWVENIQFVKRILDESISFNLADLINIFKASELKSFFEEFISLERLQYEDYKFPLNILELYITKLNSSKTNEIKQKIEKLIIDFIEINYKINPFR